MHNQVTSFWNHIVALFVPIIIFMVVGGLRRSLLEIHHGILAVLAALGLARLITQFLKHRVGRLRPDFLARCKWDKVLEACTGKEQTIVDGRKSFPSGHSSTAFSGMFLLSLWLAGQTAAWCFHVPRPARTISSSQMTRFILTLLPISWATFVAISRVEDYRHHKEDVIVGSLIGIASAWICYLIFWPNPFSAANFDQRAFGHPRLLYTDKEYERTVDFELTALEDDAANVV
ncbi:hypothetical protein K443DRAFT_493371 [Laccaria amethystina LaAM-08-1]|uniref:Phosphatidic acid phosphatase type 2/haloperoxidase domain-containing protein n=1 Tax=Laccaria amethystina LaAM-08-1 TaxID=1095629 RepID=A0A0C9XUZ6_9AGAR|nr:hypothetical protein K443DRAFT_493371 [Laccaria amethystina LaAM-08-1]